MKKIISYLKARQYLVLSIALAIVLVALNVQKIVRADETTNPPATETQETTNSTPPATTSQNIPNTVMETGSEDIIPVDLLHANCIADLEYGSTPSSTFNGNSPYNLSFVIGLTGGSGGLNGFYDINGDNLPDYVYSNSTSFTEPTNMAIANFQGCVYLNNGNGWTETYRCKAYTKKSMDNGQIITAQYYGDCAGQ